MPVESRQSIQVVVFEYGSDARTHGKGGIWYSWILETDKRFPDDVASVFIVMPVDWEDVPPEQQKGIVCEWTVSRVNRCGARWALSGTREKPTLSPSLHWVGVWHGWLRDGLLASC